MVPYSFQSIFAEVILFGYNNNAARKVEQVF